MTIPPFDPKNYPRIYKPPFDKMAQAVILGTLTFVWGIAQFINIGTYFENAPFDVTGFSLGFIWRYAGEHPLLFCNMVFLICGSVFAGLSSVFLFPTRRQG